MHKSLTILKILLALGTVSVFFIILFSSLFSHIYSLGYYESKYRKYNVYDKFPIEKARNATLNLFGFFRSANNLDSSFFNRQEQSHLQDVKSLIEKAQGIYVVSLFAFWGMIAYIYFFSRRAILWFLSRLLLYSGLFTIVLFLLAGLFYLAFGFDFAFEGFHKLFFSGNFAFDPDVSNMKSLFPDEFFSDIAGSIIIVTLLKAALLCGTGYYLLRKINNQPRH